MCGIAGILGPSFRKPFPLAMIRHRGPDDEGSWTSREDRIWLGHTRLSILDLSDAGRQPMPYLDERYRLVFNGEIYNFIELQEELRAKGYRFRSQTDTETIPAAFHYWGADCLSRFNGMWAFAIWDRAEKELWLSRDRFGKKPLYYFWDGRDFAFASEVKALHCWLGAKAQLDTRVIRSICDGKFEWHGTESTYLNNVKAVPAGHDLLLSDRRLQIRRWYRLLPQSAEVPNSLGAQAEALRAALTDACRLRLRSDVPVATCLSGGLDSSSITALIHRGIDNRGARSTADFHKAFCATFPGTMLDETAAAATLAESVGSRLQMCEIAPPAPERLMQAISACDGPMHALAFYPIWELYGRISDSGIRVTLDGQGPDEMLGGYFETIRGALRSALRRGDIGYFVDIVKTYGAQGESRYRSSKASAKEEVIRLLKYPASQLKQRILSSRSNGNGSLPPLSYAQPLPPGISPLSGDLYAQFCQKQLPTILQQYDRCSMAHGVECRMPFMDYRVVEFVFSLPDKSRVGGGFTKRVLREAIKGLVPESTRTSKIKIGFNAPIVEWFMGPLRDLMLDVMHSSSFLENPYFDGRELSARFHRWLNAPSWTEAWGFWPPVHFVIWQQQISSWSEVLPVERAASEKSAHL